MMRPRVVGADGDATTGAELRAGVEDVARRLDVLAERLARVAAALDGVRAGILEVERPRAPGEESPPDRG
jgi:hypothetical protein